jgi:hypothetical protein
MNWIKKQQIQNIILKHLQHSPQKFMNANILLQNKKNYRLKTLLKVLKILPTNFMIS